MMAATEMSISPAMISSASGNATIARSVKLKVASESVSTLRKYGDSDREDDEREQQHRRQHGLPAHETGRLHARASRMVRLNCRCRALRSTATRITAPLMNICQNAEIPTSGRLLRMMPMNRQPSTHARGRAGSTGDRDAADQAGGDHRQLEAQRDVGVGHREARHPQIAAHARDGAANRVGEELHAPRIDAGVAAASGLPPAAYRSRAARERRSANDERRGNRERQPREHRNTEELAARKCQEVARHLVLVDPRALGQQIDRRRDRWTWCRASPRWAAAAASTPAGR